MSVLSSPFEAQVVFCAWKQSPFSLLEMRAQTGSVHVGLLDEVQVGVDRAVVPVAVVPAMGTYLMILRFLVAAVIPCNPISHRHQHCLTIRYHQGDLDWSDSGAGMFLDCCYYY